MSYASRSLTKWEKAYTTTEKEALAIVFGCEQNRIYLRNGDPFTIFTDHQALVWLKDTKNLNARTTRWALRLLEYDFTIKHRKGILQGNADGLSRMLPEGEETDEETEQWKQTKHGVVKQVKCLLSSMPKGKSESMTPWVFILSHRDVGEKIVLKHNYFIDGKNLIGTKFMMAPIAFGEPWAKQNYERNEINKRFLPATVHDFVEGEGKNCRWIYKSDGYSKEYKFHDRGLARVLGIESIQKKGPITIELERDESTDSWYGRVVGTDVLLNINDEILAKYCWVKDKSKREREIERENTFVDEKKDTSDDDYFIESATDYSNDEAMLEGWKEGSDIEDMASSTSSGSEAEPTLEPDSDSSEEATVTEESKKDDESKQAAQVNEQVDDADDEADLSDTSEEEGKTSVRDIQRIANRGYTEPSYRIRNRFVMEQRADGVLKEIIDRLRIDEHPEKSDDEGYSLEQDLLVKRQINKYDKTWKAIVVPRSRRVHVLDSYHDTLLGGHMGIANTTEKIREKYCWRGMTEDVKKWVNSCQRCQLSKRGRSNNIGLHRPIICTRPFQQVHIDLAGPLVRTNKGNKYIVVMIDAFSRYVELDAIPDKTTATVANSFFQKIVCRHGCPERLCSDRGREFNSVMKRLCEIMKVKKIFTTAYNPEGNSPAERLVGFVKQSLRIFTENRIREWDTYLAPCAFVYINHPIEAIGTSPFELIFGRVPNVPADILHGEEPLRLDNEQYSINLKERLRIANEYSQEVQRKVKERESARYNEKHKETDVKVGDWVTMYRPETKKGMPKKLLRQNRGPFKVITKLRNGNFEVASKDGEITEQINPRSLKKFVHFEEGMMPSPEKSLRIIKGKHNTYHMTIRIHIYSRI